MTKRLVTFGKVHIEGCAWVKGESVIKDEANISGNVEITHYAFALVAPPVTM